MLTACTDIKPYSNNFYTGTNISEYVPQVPQYENMTSSESTAESLLQEGIVGSSLGPSSGKTFRYSKDSPLKSFLLTKDEKSAKALMDRLSNTDGNIIYIYNDQNAKAAELREVITGYKKANGEDVPMNKALKNVIVLGQAETFGSRKLYAVADGKITSASKDISEAYTTNEGYFIQQEFKVYDRTCKITFSYLSRLFDSLNNVSSEKDTTGEWLAYNINPNIVKIGSDVKASQELGEVGYTSKLLEKGDSKDFKTLFDNSGFVKVEAQCKKKDDTDFKNISIQELYNIKPEKPSGSKP